MRRLYSVKTLLNISWC